jgi:hypothetical protein
LCSLRFSFGSVILESKEAPPSDFPNPISTCGKLFTGGTFVELVRAGGSARPSLLLWDGHQQVVGDVVEFRGQRYKPRTIHETILHELKLPSRVGSFGSVRELLADICKLLDKFIGLPEKLTALIGRFVLATWLVDAMQTAPRILILGRDTVRARQLLQLLHCVCRRALPIAAVSTAGFCSLPSGMRFTLLLSESNISAELSNLLDTALRRDSPILRVGELRDLFGAQAILSEVGFDPKTVAAASIQVPCLPGGQRLPVLDHATQASLVEEYQPKMLAFRLSNHTEACATNYDASKLAIPLQELAIGLATATPGDTGLQHELLTLLQEENSEIESANWVDLNTVIIEAILVHCREAKMESVYVGEIAEMAEKILEGRGEGRKLDPGEVGRRIKTLGFSTEARDARGVKLRLTTTVCVRVHELAHQCNVPGVHECECRNVRHVGQID